MHVARDAEWDPCSTLAFSEMMGRNTQKLLARAVSVHYHHDMITCKIPVGHPHANAATPWHQDFPFMAIDRPGSLTFWIALDSVSPEQGGVRFLEGTHRRGPLGMINPEYGDLCDQYPDLASRYRTSPALELQPGDATVHSDLTVHGAPANQTDQHRWSYVLNYVASDALYNGQPNRFADNHGLKVGAPLMHPDFPIVYPALAR